LLALAAPFPESNVTGSLVSSMRELAAAVKGWANGQTDRDSSIKNYVSQAVERSSQSNIDIATY
jgi:hypothetical protein